MSLRYAWSVLVVTGSIVRFGGRGLVAFGGGFCSVYEAEGN